MQSDQRQSIKNPENEAENPAPMPKADQGAARPADKPRDPEGQQGSNQPGRTTRKTQKL